MGIRAPHRGTADIRVKIGHEMATIGSKRESVAILSILTLFDRKCPSSSQLALPPPITFWGRSLLRIPPAGAAVHSRIPALWTAAPARKRIRQEPPYNTTTYCLEAFVRHIIW